LPAAERHAEFKVSSDRGAIGEKDCSSQDHRVTSVEESQLPTQQEQQEQEEALAQDPYDKWYVIHTYSGYENRVQKNLQHRVASMDVQDKIFKVVVPVEEVIEVKEGQRRTVQRKVFPGYVLVQMEMADDAWYVVRNTPGVTGFVGSGNKPTMLRPDEVKAILKQTEAEAPKVKVAFSRGQSVRIIDGPFADFLGVVDDINHEKGKVRVLVSFFGRETPVELDFLQVEKL
jgi:transcription termination/antitermination protein NusG